MAEAEDATAVVEATGEEQSPWPQPVPEDWKQSRATKAEDWFQTQKEALHKRFHDSKREVVEDAEAAAAQAAEAAAFDGTVHRMVAQQQAVSRSVQQQLSVLRQQRLSANLEYKALRLPHFTPPRRLALIAAPDGGPSFLERLFNRALATTLMAAAAPLPGTAGGPGSYGTSGGGGAGGPEGQQSPQWQVPASEVMVAVDAGEAVWCELGQSHISLQDPQLARAEALERCQLAVVVLSQALLDSPTWPLERRILAARLAAPPGTWPGPPLAGVVLVRLHVPPPAAAVAAAQASAAGLGRKASAAVAAAVAAAAAPPDPAAADPNPLGLPVPVPGYPVQRYPVVEVAMPVPRPGDAPGEGAAAGTALAQAVREAVSEVLRAASAPGPLYPGGGGLLAAAGLCMVPDPPPVHLHPAHVHGDPESLLAAALAAGAGGDLSFMGGPGGGYSLNGYGSPGNSLSGGLGGGGTGGRRESSLGASLGVGISPGSTSLATQLLASRANAPVAPGAAAAAAHMLPAAHAQRPVEDWTMYDTVVWLASLGRSMAKWSPGFLALAVDGPLLAAAEAEDLRACCGVAAAPARAALAEALAGALARAPELLPSRLLLPGPAGPATPLPPEAAVLPAAQRGAVLMDVFRYYDTDHSGDLDQSELGRLVVGCGLRLGEERLKDVLDDYDDDADGRLCALEALRLLEDVWRLVMAQQDVAAWTPAQAEDLLKDTAELDEAAAAAPWDTPRATPDADLMAQVTLQRRQARASDASAAAASEASAPSVAQSICIVGSRRPSGAGPDTYNAPPKTAPGGRPHARGHNIAAAEEAAVSASNSAMDPFGGGGGGGPLSILGEDESGAEVRLIDYTTPRPRTQAAAGGGLGAEASTSSMGGGGGGGGFAAAQARARAALKATVGGGVGGAGGGRAAAASSSGVSVSDSDAGINILGDGGGGGGSSGRGGGAATSGAPSRAGSRAVLKRAQSSASFAWGVPPRLSVNLAAGGGNAPADTVAAAVAAAPAGSGAAAALALQRPPRPGGRPVPPLLPALAAADVDAGKLLRPELGDMELREALNRVLDGLDLRRAGIVEVQHLRAALASSGPFHLLTPLHTQLLSELAEAQAQLPADAARTAAAAAAATGGGARQGVTTVRGGGGLKTAARQAPSHSAMQVTATGATTRAADAYGTGGGRRAPALASGGLGEALVGMEVAAAPYTAAAVEAVNRLQSTLMGVVYGERGLSPMLRQLYRQSAGADDPLELLTAGGPRVKPAAAEAALAALLEVAEVPPSALVLAALLPGHQQPDEAEADEDEDYAGAGSGGGGGSRSTPLSLHSARRYPQAWASVTAHVLHVYQTLLQKCS
ncbi:hypothetical protein HXX76_003132 [Chlamydomonas incerta]|uniref:EF-hand domain-containing protein n=1 Tax=Chlamydomonas incerta TaxID=51695 RepID=A0A835TMB2_CHLIN|nr:hypothetical protein HXX76_003132 [Chlamydomonas incerta]|eukprot:KAG2441510.1 hypothetical protein HXX76_003132 [Chlamydomonas incerta]